MTGRHVLVVAAVCAGLAGAAVAWAHRAEQQHPHTNTDPAGAYLAGLATGRWLRRLDNHSPGATYQTTPIGEKGGTR